MAGLGAGPTTKIRWLPDLGSNQEPRPKRKSLEWRPQAPVHNRLRRLDFVQQIGMPIQNLEQFHERQRRLRFSILVSGERVDAAPEDFRRFTLIQAEFLAHGGYELWINDCGVYLCLLNSSIKALVRTDSLMSRTASPHEGQ